MADRLEKIKIKQTAFALAALCTVTIGAIFLMVFAPSNDSFVSVGGVSSSAKLSLHLEQKGKALALTGEKHAFEKPGEIIGSYILRAGIEEGGAYKDIDVFVDDTKDSVTVRAGGFAPKETLTLRLGDKTILEDLYFDWAGRIELSHDFGSEKSAPLCLETSSGFSICHVLPKGGRA